MLNEEMSEASDINASINKEEQEEKTVQPEQGDKVGLVNESEDEEKPSTSSGNASSRPPQVQVSTLTVSTVSYSREGKEDVRLAKNRQKARDTRKRRKIMTGEMRRQIVSLQKVNQDLQEKSTALQDALERALQDRNATATHPFYTEPLHLLKQYQMQSPGPQMASRNTDYNTIRGTRDFPPRVNSNEIIHSRQTQQLIAEMENRQRRDTENLMFPYGRPS
uniref:BZIP domain-containing protein n=1 Tax=Attheya septentrionalis TaxID=420275 RepID=A0A6T7GY78_9STRA|mmetsp:Transcript_18687/g.33887  ORF Transcript_18687/g.33887 Transcript_18687/m.33887 type:complete len:221 (+) Transcript_18687:139-801(+)